MQVHGICNEWNDLGERSAGDASPNNVSAGWRDPNAPHGSHLNPCMLGLHTCTLIRLLHGRPRHGGMRTNSSLAGSQRPSDIRSTSGLPDYSRNRPPGTPTADNVLVTMILIPHPRSCNQCCSMTDWQRDSPKACLSCCQQIGR